MQIGGIVQVMDRLRSIRKHKFERVEEAPFAVLSKP